MKKMLWVCLLAACTGSPSTQVVTGNVTSNSAVAVRAVADSEVVTASRVRSDGSFTLSLPAGKQYRLEVMTSAGAVLPVGPRSAAVTFKVCQPQDPWDMGGVGSGPPPPPPGCDPADPTTCKPPPPPPDCDPATDPNGCKPPPPPNCDPATDPNGCMPPPGCDPATDPNGCKPPPPPNCDPATDPNGCMPPPGCDPATDPNGCKPPMCDPSTDPTCQLPPPPCADPNDPDTCKDPCMADPSQCACGPSMDAGSGSGTTAGSGSGSSGGGTCWPPPLPPGDCDGTMAPAHPPGDFGCGGSTGS